MGNLKWVGNNKYRKANIERLTYQYPGFIIKELKVDGKPHDMVELVTTAEHGAVNIDSEGNMEPLTWPTPFSVGSARCICGAVVFAKDNMLELDMAFTTHCAYPDIPLPKRPRVARLPDTANQNEGVNWLSVNAPVMREKVEHDPG